MSTVHSDVYPRSVVSHEGATYFLTTDPESGARTLGVAGPSAGFSGGAPVGEAARFPCTPENLAELRRRLPWLTPQTLGLRTSFGFGDRIGCATPGHIQALRAADPRGVVAPIFAQQSVRENTRTGRTPAQVMDDATWDLFAEGWRAPWGADADHVKEPADLAAFVAVGYTFYTIDPSDYVDASGHTAGPAELRAKIEALPWGAIGTSYEALRARYCARPFQLAGLSLEFDEVTLQRALVKYSRAVVHTAAIAAELRRLRAGAPYELEMSVDETDTPTTLHEHFFIASELRARDLPVASLAPRFVGSFQKGVDYIGDPQVFAQDLAGHVAIMAHFDYYKLSIHTGSDKFSIYPTIAEQTAGRVHVKTAGTSYLEALRLVAARDPGLFREMLDEARAGFEANRKTYALDARLERVPTGAELRDSELAGLLDQFDARQVLHVAFGALLQAHGPAIRALLQSHAADYRAGLEQHFVRHIQPFVSK